MELEAVWLKDGREIQCVCPVLELTANGEGVEGIVVYNGYSWYDYKDVCNIADEIPNGFLVRARANDGT